MDYTVEIKDCTLEYIDEDHIYLVNGVIVPSITQLLKVKFGRKYEGIDQETLNKAADAGTKVHEAIEHYCKTGEESDLPEVRNFKFLQKQYGFDVVANEAPVILFKDEEPIAAGRLDLVLQRDGKIGGADIKRTSTLDKEYLTYQLNLYRIAYRQCYDVEWEFLSGLHLRENTRKYVDIPIREDAAWELVDEYERSKNE